MANDDFIGIYDNVLTREECQNIIKYFEEMRKYNLVFDRQSTGEALPHEKKDETCFLMDTDTFYLDKTHPVLVDILAKFWKCYQDYSKKYSVLVKSCIHGISSIRVQKTEPSGGYHTWHYENNGKQHSGRFLAFTIYLNTVPIGGETEFLYLNERVNAVEGRVILWPAGFTHTHRGNQPIGASKYIVTGWVEFFE